MKTLIVGMDAEIIEGALQGYKGRLVAFDSEYDSALVQLDSLTCIQTNSENIIQEGDSVQLIFEFNDLKEELDKMFSEDVLTKEDWLI